LRIKKLPPIVDRLKSTDLWISAPIAHRLKIAAGERVPEIAQRIGLDPSTVYKWLAGRFEPGLVKLGEFAAAANVSLAWLVTGEGPRDARAAARHALLADYAFVELEPDGAGKPTVAFHEPWLAETLLGPHHDPKLSYGDMPVPLATLMLVDDDGMEPTIRKGDLLLLDRGSGLKPAEIERAWKEGRSQWDGIYAFRAPVSGRPEKSEETHLVARRLRYRLDGTMVIGCDNPKYPEESYPPKAKKRPGAVGRVIWRGGRI
jgi:phage repressor protein C with HTH and peptisase S24 domain